MSNRTQPSRRHLLRAGAGGAALLGASRMPALSMLGQGGGGDDYKALVCVFLFGGADTLNLLVPAGGSDYGIYLNARGGLAESADTLLPISPKNPQGSPYGVHGHAPGLRARFESGDLAFLANVGPLIAPLKKAQFESGEAELPPFLFSHSDQQVQWQTAHANGTQDLGWAGRMLDRMPSVNGASPLSAAISINGASRLLVGHGTRPYIMGTGGTAKLWSFSTPGMQARLQDVLAAGTHPLERAFADVQQTSIEIDELVSGGLQTAPQFGGLFPDTYLGAQLRMVARLISMRHELGMTRQVFFVGTGDYDTHDDQAARLPQLFGELSHALDDFQSAIDQIGERPNVVSFTHSEFGRTLSSNGKGSDHGWGAHSLVLGGPVRGRDIYGELPDLAPDGDHDIGEGRLLPTTSVDQVAATLARWFGLSEAELPQVFPNLPNFESGDLGFL